MRRVPGDGLRLLSVRPHVVETLELGRGVARLLARLLARLGRGAVVRRGLVAGRVVVTRRLLRRRGIVVVSHPAAGPPVCKERELMTAR